MTVSGGNPPQRPDQRLQPRSRAGSGPAPQQNVFAHLIIVPGGTITIGAGGEIILASGGSIMGTDWILNQHGYFQYDGTPAAGNLVLTYAPTFGTDAFGNAYAGQSPVHQTISANGQTFLSSESVIVFAGGGGGFTGLIMQPGTFSGQPCQVVNLNATGSLTMAVQATSNVAGGVSNVITPNSASGFVWYGPNNLWYSL